MPVHYAIEFRHIDLHQTTTAWSPGASTGFGLVRGCVGCAQQPMAGDVEYTIGLVVQFHCDVAAAIQLGVGLTLIPDSKSTACLAPVQHIERHAIARFGQVC